MFQLLYVTDLHGWTDGYEQISMIAQEEDITTIVNGGDMLPHAQNLIFAQRRFIEEYLYSYFERLDASGISYYGMLGNDDCRTVLPDWQDLVKTYPRLHDLTEEWLPLAGSLTIRGCNYIPDPPFRLKDWCVLDTRDYVRPSQHPGPIVSKDSSFESIEDIHAFFAARPTLKDILHEIAESAVSFERSVFVCHAPPLGTGLGNIGTDADVGSAAVKTWIQRWQPLLTLHGHIHESCLITGTDTVTIGRTTVHQPGQERLWRRLAYSIVEIDGNAVLVDRRRVCLK